MLFYLVLSILLGLVAALDRTNTYYDLADAKQLFEDFIKKYEKKYESPDEYNRRLEIFKNKLSMINQWNKIHEPTFSINEFADKDPSEKRTGFVPSRLRNKARKLKLSMSLLEYAPNTLDYRDFGLVTEVKNQGNCNSCYIFGAVGNIEGQLAKLTREPAISLSEQQVLDCVGNPCDIGGDHLIVMRLLSVGDGLQSKADYLHNYYHGIDQRDHYCGHNHLHCYTNKENVIVKVTSEFSIYTPDEETLKAALIKHGPLAISIYVSNSIKQYDGRAVLKPFDCSGNESPNHSVLLVGYSTDDDGTPYWIIKNSWGKNWGHHGYLHLEMGKGHCSILKTGAVSAEVMRV